MRGWRASRVVGCALPLLATGCEMLSELSRQEAQWKLSWFRRSAWSVVVITALAVVARLAVRWTRTATVSVLLACVAVPATMIAGSFALQRSPSELAVGKDQKSLEEQGCVLRPDRTVSCWQSGRFDDEALAGLALDPIAEPVRVGRWVECPVVVKRVARDTKAIAVGDAHASALLDDGTLLTWGTNDKGQLGRDADRPRDDTPRAVPGLRFAEVGAQGATTCGRTVDGGVFCWGDVDGTITRAPAPVAGLAHVERLFFTHGCACALSGGSLSCWMRGCVLPLRDETRLREIAGEVPRPDPAVPHRIGL